VRIGISCPAPGRSGSMGGSVCDGISRPGMPGLIEGNVNPAVPRRASAGASQGQRPTLAPEQRRSRLVL
jgi:hypothetical protein